MPIFDFTWQRYSTSYSFYVVFVASCRPDRRAGARVATDIKCFIRLHCVGKDASTPGGVRGTHRRGRRWGTRYISVYAGFIKMMKAALSICLYFRMTIVL